MWLSGQQRTLINRFQALRWMWIPLQIPQQQVHTCDALFNSINKYVLIDNSFHQYSNTLGFFSSPKKIIINPNIIVKIRPWIQNVLSWLKVTCTWKSLSSFNIILLIYLSEQIYSRYFTSFRSSRIVSSLFSLRAWKSPGLIVISELFCCCSFSSEASTDWDLSTL